MAVMTASEDTRSEPRDILKDKSLLRERIRETLRRQAPNVILAKSRAIVRRIFASESWKTSRTVFAFLSIEREVDTSEIISRALDDGKTVGVPRVAGERLVFHRIQGLGEDFQRGPFGIREPHPEWPELDPCSPSLGAVLVVTPGLAFDRERNRLGRGKGYYDRFFDVLREGGRSAVISFGVCFSEQLVPHVPFGPGDRRVDGIVTESEIIT